MLWSYFLFDKDARELSRIIYQTCTGFGRISLEPIFAGTRKASRYINAHRIFSAWLTKALVNVDTTAGIRIPSKTFWTLAGMRSPEIGTACSLATGAVTLALVHVHALQKWTFKKRIKIWLETRDRQTDKEKAGYLLRGWGLLIHMKDYIY